MRCWRFVLCAAGLLAIVGARELVSAAAASTQPNLAGVWRLNRDLSEFPRDVGFGPEWQDPDSKGRQSGGRSGGGGRGGGRGGGGGGSVNIRPPMDLPESEEDSLKVQQLIGEVRDPSPVITIVQNDASVTIKDDRGITRAFHTNGKEEFLKLDAGPMGTTSKWEGGKLVIEYRVEKGRQLRYTYVRAGARLQVQVQLLEHAKGAPIKRIYDSAS